MIAIVVAPSAYWSRTPTNLPTYLPVLRFISLLLHTSDFTPFVDTHPYKRHAYTMSIINEHTYISTRSPLSCRLPTPANRRGRYRYRVHRVPECCTRALVHVLCCSTDSRETNIFTGPRVWYSSDAVFHSKDWFCVVSRKSYIKLYAVIKYST
jgi:hypothetical protein